MENIPLRIVLHAGDENYEFNPVERNKFSEYEEMVKQIYPEKAK